MGEDCKNYVMCNNKKKTVRIILLAFKSLPRLCMAGRFEIMTSELHLGEVRRLKFATYGPTTLYLQKIGVFL
jgi:hypothetical protein